MRGGHGFLESVRRALRILRYHAPPDSSLQELDMFVGGLDCVLHAWPVPVAGQTRLQGLAGAAVALLPHEWLLTFQARRVPFAAERTPIPWEEKRPVAFWRGNALSAECQLYSVQQDLGLGEEWAVPDVPPPAGEPCEHSLWRGRAAEAAANVTGGFWGARFTLRNWWLHPRGRLALLSHLAPNQVDAKFTIATAPDKVDEAGEIRRLLAGLGLMAKGRADAQEHARYRYLVTVDFSDRVYWLLQFNAVVLIAETGLAHLFLPSRILRPYEHFLPLKADLSDLLEKLAWAEAHPREAAFIAQRGSQHARRLFGHEEMLHYLYRVVEAHNSARRAANSRSSDAAPRGPEQ